MIEDSSAGIRDFAALEKLLREFDAAATMNFTLWLTIAAVSAVTAVILARRKNRSAVIWSVASFVFPLALLPLFALAPLAENNTRSINRRFLAVVSLCLVSVVGLTLLEYQSLHP